MTRLHKILRRAHSAFYFASALAIPSVSSAQVSLYSFSQVSGPYVPLSPADGGYTLGVPVFNPPNSELTSFADPALPDGVTNFGGYLTPVFGPGYPIGFNFTYNGDVFDRIGISTGGWISFGKSTDGDNAIWIFTSDHPAGRPLSHDYNSPVPSYKRNRIAGYALTGMRQQDMSSVGGPVSSFRVATIGTAPNRVCVIEWKDFRNAYSTDDSRLNFQIRLTETTNTVDVAFGEMEWGYGGSGSRQVGLGGQNNADYNNRMTPYLEPSFVYNWNTTVPGVDSVSVCVAGIIDPFGSAGSAIPPVPGLKFRWSPPTCPPPAWPVDVTEITFHSALVSWTSPPDAASYDYVIATIDDPADPNAINTGNTEEVSILVEGLEPLTYYYVFVRSRCGGQPGDWSAATRFRSQGGAVLECGGDILQEDYCYATGDRIVWTYSTSNGTSGVRLNMLAGNMQSGNTLEVFYGPDTTGTPFWSSASGGLIPGQVFTSTPSSYLTILLYAPQNGSCQVHEFIEALQWTVGCLDCTAPLASFAVTNEDCAAFEYDVQVTLVSMGSATSLSISNSQEVAPSTVTATGTYTVGPFAAGEPVVITLENLVNSLCNVSSVPLINDPCPVVDCGPTDYTYCYLNNDNMQRLYQGDGLPVGIRFRSGSTYGADAARVYDGVDDLTTPTDLSGDLANELVTSTNVDFALLLTAASDGVLSCEDGYATEWDYVVACYDGCTQPTASFAVGPDCDNEQFSITVNLTAVGSTGTVSITNDGGAPAVTATAIGTYTVGPFDSQDEVNVEVVGASVLCSWTSPKLTYDCTGVGIAERAERTLRLYPNPSEGMFRLELPEGSNGSVDLQVLDLQGRIVLRKGLSSNAGKVFELDLTTLPSGAYMIMMNDTQHVYSGKVQIVH